MPMEQDISSLIPGPPRLWHSVAPEHPHIEQPIKTSAGKRNANTKAARNYRAREKTKAKEREEGYERERDERLRVEAELAASRAALDRVRSNISLPTTHAWLFPFPSLGPINTPPHTNTPQNGLL